MPFFTESEMGKSRAAVPFSPLGEAPPPPTPLETPGWFETLGAMLGNEFNPAAVYGAISEGVARYDEADDWEFDPFKENEHTPYEAYPEAFVTVFNRDQMMRQRKRLDGEIRDRDIIARSPFWQQLTTGIAVGLIDPVNYIALAGPVSRGFNAIRTGRSAMLFAREGAKAGLVSTVASEAILQTNQNLRTVEESGLNIVLATGLGAGIGGLIGASVGRKARVSRDTARLGTAAEARFRRMGVEGVPAAPRFDAAEAAQLSFRAGELADAPAAPARPLESSEVIPGVLSIGEDGVAKPVYRGAEPPLYREGRPPVREVDPEAGKIVPDLPVRPSAPTTDFEGSWSVVPGEGQSLSAAAADPQEIKIFGGRAAEIAAAPSRVEFGSSRIRGLRFMQAFENPVAWMLTSPSQALRRIAELMAYTPTLTKNMAGIASAVPAEAMVAQGRAMLASAVRSARQHFVAYRKTKTVAGAAVQGMRGQAGGKLDLAGFKSAAYDVVRDGTPHPVPEVNQLAAEISLSLDKVKQDAIDAGVLEAGVNPTTAKNYIMRIYDRPRIEGERILFQAILRHWIKSNGAKIEAEAINSRKALNDYLDTRQKLIDEMPPGEVKMYEAERNWSQGNRRVAAADKEFAALVEEYRLAGEKVREIQESPNRRGMADREQLAIEDAQVIEKDMRLAESELANAKLSRDASRDRFNMYRNTVENWPGKLQKAIIERRNSRLETMRAQAEIALRALKKLEVEIATNGPGPKKYAEWLDLRAARMPAGVRPRSLVQTIIDNGGIKDSSGELREIVAKSVKKGKSGEADARYALSKLISKDANARSLDDVAESAWRDGYIGRLADDGDRPSIDELLEAIDNDASGLAVNDRTQSSRIYSVRELDDLAQWEDFEWIRERKAELASDPDFKSGRAITSIINKWRAEAAQRVAKMNENIDVVVKERDAARTKLDEMSARAAEIEKNRTRLERQIEKEKARAESFEGMVARTDEELDDIVRALTDDMLGLHGESSAMNLNSLGVKRRGPLADRSLLIPDDYDAGPMMIGGVKRSGRFDQFVVKDTDRVMGAVMRNLSPDIALHRNFGSVDLADEFAKISADFEHQAAMLERQTSVAMENAKTDAEKDAIQKRHKRLDGRLSRERKRSKNVLDAQIARLRGTFGAEFYAKHPYATRFFEAAKTLNFMRLMGNVVVSSIPDPAMIAKAHGLPALTNALRVAAGDWETFSKAVQTGPRIGQAVDVVLSRRAAATGDLNSDFLPTTKWEAQIQWLGQKVGNAFLIGHWTDFWKGVDVVVAQDRILRNVKDFMDGKPLSDMERRYMAAHYIGDAEMVKIWGQFQHTKEGNGLRWAEMGEWTDSEARRLFSAALNKDSDTNIIVPGLDKPIWMSDPVWSVLAQFKSYTFVSMSRIMVSGLQEFDARQAFGTALLLAGGALSYMLTAATKGENPFEESPQKWAAEAIDRSGVAGWLSEVNAVADKMGFGLNALTGEKELSRFAGRSIFDQFLGPTAGLAKDWLQVPSDITSEIRRQMGDTDQKGLTGDTIGTVRKTVPLENWFVTRYLTDEVERGVAEFLGVKPRTAIRRDEKVDAASK